MALLNISGGAKVKFFGSTTITSYGYGYGTSDAGSLATDLQAFYRLSDTSDSSGNGNTLTNNGSVSFSSGKIGNAATFTSAGGGQSLASSVNGRYASGMSTSLWFKKTGSKSTSGLIQAASADKTGWTVINESNSGLFFLAGNGSWGLQTSSFLSVANMQGVWNHLVITDDNTNIKIYVNNSLVNTSSTPTYATASVKLGIFEFFSGNNAQTFDGQIDAAGIWSRALTTGEISDLYNSGAGTEI